MESERRSGMSDIQTDIALIKQKSEFFEKAMLTMASDIKELKTILQGDNILKKDAFDGHVIQDRWMFGITVTMLVFIFGKLIQG